jgi:hypothetical protein
MATLNGKAFFVRRATGGCEREDDTSFRVESAALIFGFLLSGE